MAHWGREGSVLCPNMDTVQLSFYLLSSIALFLSCFCVWHNGGYEGTANQVKHENVTFSSSHNSHINHCLS